MQELSNNRNKLQQSYNAADITILEGLEPVRRRPGMYIGGTDENSLHHLVNEVFDNCMDEVVAGFATYIEVRMNDNGSITIADNGRGIPVDPHPKYPDKSALEIILTTLHSGGKFNDKIYNTSGGLHGVGLSVVNALSVDLEIEVLRDKKSYIQHYSRGEPLDKLIVTPIGTKKQGTKITFKPDSQIFGKLAFKPSRIYKLARSKAYLFKGVEIKWFCSQDLLDNQTDIPVKDVIHFPGGLEDYLNVSIEQSESLLTSAFVGSIKLANSEKKIEWAATWLNQDTGFTYSYCNTIPTPLGGTHENGFKNAILKSLKSYGEATSNKKVSILTLDDVCSSFCMILSLFMYEPQFQGQTKEKLVSAQITKIVENAIKDHFDHWLSSNKNDADKLIEKVIEIAEERLSRKLQKETARKQIFHKIRLPGKLADCSRKIAVGTEIFLVEGDSAGGSAKQARDRETQAVLPLRGKVLNVASSTQEKIMANQELSDLELALGCGVLSKFSVNNLRYEKVIIMTDADVDGAHIASLLLTFFFKQMPGLITGGHLYLACPPLYRIHIGTKILYASSDNEKDKIVDTYTKQNKKIDVGRFKGLGEMTASQLKETTMSQKTRNLVKVYLQEDSSNSEKHLNNLMGKKPEYRFKFIQEKMLDNGQYIKENLDL